MAFLPTRLARACSLALLASSAVMAAEPARNVILFIPDGLRANILDAQTAPNLAQLRREGVNFQNSHSLFPTFTTPNASALATGHYLGDTGDFSNTIYTGFPVPGANNSVTPFLENDEVLGDVDEHF
ncbi:alkaline phosphatase family protein, partial [Pseudomonas mandelii]|uniref:alkaline phosphatase family protein n=1 Tax=Pseudomonas mandelii TaxID=75612 RepID=UPI0011B76E9B